MQLELVLMRHGHARDGSNDRARPLSNEGRAAARLTGERLKAEGLRPDEAWVSDATRALETWAAIAPLFETTKMIERPALYLASGDAVRALLAEAEAPSLLWIGHNPGLSELANRLDRHALALRPADAHLVRREATSWSACF